VIAALPVHGSAAVHSRAGGRRGRGHRVSSRGRIAVVSAPRCGSRLSDHLVFALDEAAGVLTRADVPEGNVSSHRAKERHPDTNEHWNPRDDEALNELRVEKTLNGNSPVHVRVRDRASCERAAAGLCAIRLVIVVGQDVDERVHAVDKMSADIADDEVTFGQRETERVGRIHVPDIATAQRSAKVGGVACAGYAFGAGATSPSSGGATNSRRHGLAITRAHRFARLTRALSVAMPVFAYIWRYNFEIKTNASRARSVGVQRERLQILGRL